jgi:hypothetical protein
MKWLWGQDDVRLMGDAVAITVIVPLLRAGGRLAARGGKLILMKGLLEPLAVMAYNRGWSWVDRLLGDRLPQWPPRETQLDVDSGESLDCRSSRL